MNKEQQDIAAKVARDKGDQPQLGFAGGWNSTSEKFDTKAEYKASFRERAGWFRGAKVRRR